MRAHAAASLAASVASVLWTAGDTAVCSLFAPSLKAFLACRMLYEPCAMSLSLSYKPKSTLRQPLPKMKLALPSPCCLATQAQLHVHE